MSEVRIIRPDQRDRSTAQTPGMERAEGVGSKTVDAKHMWVGHVTMDRAVRSGPHHHGDLESTIYVISGRARLRFGDHLEHSVEAEAGDFIFVPPHVIHQEINPDDAAPIEMIVARSGRENVVVNVDIPEGSEEA